MKVLQVLDQLNQGGTERVAVDLAILLAKKKGIEVSFYCLLAPSVLDKELLQEGIKVEYLNRKNKYDPKKLIQLFSEFNKYDIIHLHSRQVLRYAGLLYLFRQKRNFKMIFHDHFGTIEIDKNFTSYLKFCIHKMNAYIGVSQTLINWVKKNELHEKVYLLSNIIRIKNEFLELEKPGDIIVIGNFRPQKNYEFLCELISELPENISVDLYGDPIDKDYHKKIVELAEKLNISNRLTMIKGKSNVSRLIKNYKLGVHCAPSETGPLVVIEYLSKGIPFVMYQTGEVAKVMEKYHKNSTINNFNKAKWVKAILKLYDDRNFSDNIIKINNQIFVTNYSEKKYIEKCLKIYQNIQNS